MTINAGMFSSATDQWATPLDLFATLDAEFHFETDVCALPDNAKCAHYFTPEIDGLAQEWRGACWMNPPYGRQIGAWMRKAYESAQAGATVVCLVPARTDTAWWHDYAMRGEIRFIRGRVKFSGYKWSAPFPSAIVVFRGGIAPNAGKCYNESVEGFGTGVFVTAKTAVVKRRPPNPSTRFNGNELDNCFFDSRTSAKAGR